jgi:3'-phosphoadenosine 5'-phosphosulfate (PAPS) 3'-phosphatase
MGCPNLHLDNVLQPSIAAPGARSTADPASISYIEPSVQYPPAASTAGQERRVFSPSTGSLHFAVSGRGAFARSLSQPLGAAFEVQVSSVKEGRDSKLCESAEASHGDRSTTIRVSSALRLKADFIHLDGQCKYCVVGAGSAEGNMRLPPLGYIEKIWDHAPGGHYIMEAGGDMTDLNGQRLDFSLGRLLAASVTGIVASNGVVHKIILDAISGARREEAKLVEAGSQSSRPLGMN